nr:T9SS type A sorting domain-containing protein [Saprospiraceae bacterium]
VSYRITPEKDDDHLNGVSTLDLVMIQRHILQIDKFNSAYKYIAADVNKDNKVTAGDLVELRKLILGIYIELPNNKSWRFLDKAINISDIANPWGVNEYIGINNFTTSMMENNFTGVKVGDINGSAVTNFNGASTENRSKTLTFVAEDQSFQAGQNVKMDITADNFTNMSGAQWTINFDQTSMEFQGVSSGAIQMNNENVNVLQANNGKLAFSWNDFKGVTIDKDKVLFTIEFRATANNTLTNTVKFSSDITKAEAYTHDLSEINLGLTFRNDNTSDAVFALDQNNPNPFTATTSIGFTLPSAGEAKLTIYDITGKVLKTITNTYPKGRSEVNIASEEINAQGVMFYELESNGLKATKKMIYLNK